ncbi:uncharacterized protein LOC135145350 isoform X2 [Zophobas morio]|uniref:uncharacterized protein LOC135145350 isoform X2 n=1 Tax=Zophobas morio TaxID=2755281 RepID=UPI003082EE73
MKVFDDTVIEPEDLSYEQKEMVASFVDEVNRFHQENGHQDELLPASFFRMRQNSNNGSPTSRATLLCPSISAVTALRFLKARSFNYAVALNLYKENYSIRQTLKKKVKVEDILKFVRMGCIHFNGLAKDKTMCLVADVSRFIPRQTDSTTIAFLLTFATDLVSYCIPSEKVTVLVDCSNFSIFKNVEYQMIPAIIPIVNVCMPEILARVFLLNTPYAMRKVWNFIKGSLGPKTVEKIHFLEKDESDKIFEFVDKGNLEKKFGGSLETDFSEAAQASTLDNLVLGSIEAVSYKEFPVQEYLRYVGERLALKSNSSNNSFTNNQ